MEKSQKSAVIFANIMMIIFYLSIFGIMLGTTFTIIEQKVSLLFYTSIITFFISIFSSLLVEILDEPFKSNIKYKAKWRWK